MLRSRKIQNDLDKGMRRQVSRESRLLDELDL